MGEDLPEKTVGRKNGISRDHVFQLVCSVCAVTVKIEKINERLRNVDLGPL